jgi:ABC-type antimicrobial peptide transport system permease subunit
MSGDLSFGQRWLEVLGRLRPGISLDAATASLRAIENEVLEPWMIEQHRHIELVPCGRGLMPAEQRREGKVVSLLTSAVMALVLATAAANLAGLLIGRGVSRRREFAIQLALGATRPRVARQLLICLGLYGVISYHVAQRTREIGLRMALGALRGQVMLLILRRGLFLMGLGALIGSGLAIGTSRFVRHLLYGVGPVDPLTYAGVVVVLGIVAGLACWLPARRAAGVDPMEALRSE